MSTEQSNKTTMLAWQYHTHGEPSEVLKQEEVQIPSPAPTQVLVKVKSAALNPVGNKSMKLFPSFMIKKPCIAEMDVSGVVVGVGKDVSSMKDGDEVYGIIPGELQFKTGVGALAQYTVLDQNNTVKKPDNINWHEAAAVPLASLTAYEGLVDIAKLQSGQRVFVNGGSGGVGTVAIQIAKAIGAYVICSCSAANMEFVKQQGSDEAVDYRAADLSAQLKSKFNENKFDVIFDAIGSKPLFDNCESYMKEEGIFVQIGAPLGSFTDNAKLVANLASNMLLPAFLGGVRRRYKLMMMKPKKEYLDAINQFVIDGKLKPTIDSTYSFDEALKAYERIMSDRARGKVVVQISQ